ncbi:MAG TPA: Asp-tRNA(Asn)/Glu-tRNA(Gln) amidotransferase GatCAB subunit B [Sphingobacteriaceae bacterium]|nr:Asp-tRNA(Asn)/Glu-tRNA(Gln) amidotransferase GatCAB subunit B [Sphingobacteriaceae bacterium]
MKISDNSLDKYELVVGLEVHAQLATQSKIFSSDSASFGADANNHISSITLGLPGTLPKINKKVVEYAVKMGLATHCSINLVTRFDRKNYFYADLPKGYQITQDEAPICIKGYIKIALKDQDEKKIRINRIHMEDDAGKSLHDKDAEYSLIDLNRAGVPLIEIVSEPDLRSAEEAVAYLSEIRRLVRYLEICDGNMEEGSLRCDANISVRLKGTEAFGNRCEVKNLNSMRNMQRAINYEFKRQVELLENNKTIEQNTLNFDAVSGETSVLRSKEMAYDYRYFPEPDLPPLHLTEEWIRDLEKQLPELPEARIKRYIKEYNLSEYDAMILTSEKAMADFFESITGYTKNYKSLANWLIGPVQSYLNENNKTISELPVTGKYIAEIIALVDKGVINNSGASQQLFPALINNPKTDIMQLIDDLNLHIDTSADTMGQYIDEVISKYPEKVSEYNKGKKGVLGLFMGEVMRLTNGKIDPRTANKEIIEKLESLK